MKNFGKYISSHVPSYNDQVVTHLSCYIYKSVFGMGRQTSFGSLHSLLFTITGYELAHLIRKSMPPLNR